MHLLPFLGELVEAPGPEHQRMARMLGFPGDATRKDFTNLFVIQLFPYASLYLNPSGMADGNIKNDIVLFFRQLNAPPPNEPDHLSTLLKWYAHMQRAAAGGRATDDTTMQLRHLFFWSVIASWLPAYLLRARELGSQLYRGWADVTLDALEAEAAQVGLPTLLPPYLAVAPPQPPVGEAAAFVESLFVPAVSGIVLCRADLGRCAELNQLPIRVADRRHTLKLFLHDKVPEVCSWLHDEALRQAENLRALADVYGPVREHWASRAESCAQAMLEFSARWTGQRPFSQSPG